MTMAPVRRYLSNLPVVIDVKTEFAAQGAMPWMPN